MSRALVWLCFVSSLCSGIYEVKGSLWYELITHQLERIEEKLTERNNVTQARIDNLTKNVETDNLNLLDRIAKLETTMLSKQRSMESQLKGIAASVSTLNNQTGQILKNHFDLVIPSCGMAKTTGVYRLQAPNMDVFCESSGGGWLVIQRRFHGETNFYRTWYDYRTGFDTVRAHSELWMGLEPIHQLTAGGQYELFVYIENELQQGRHARYSEFKVSEEADGYRLTVGGYSGTAGDALSSHNGAKFSTSDVDNDRNGTMNCADELRSGWWFTDCGASNLNGLFKKASNGYGIAWGSWTKAGRYSKMMIRRK
ncbi:fibrinogen-like protein A [Culex pipiens pallens]|uniref:fibrinogen-like protein A n=1 Tax=Culex pipiens pallens TaxID=42434 RepID=UPI0022AA74CC|nr:fibrinogen-like protein A [Culex pipiens pallens]